MKRLLEAAALLLGMAVLLPVISGAAAQAIPFLIAVLALGLIWRIVFDHSRRPW